MLAERDALLADIVRRPLWDAEFGKGKMLGILIAADANGRRHVLRAYSGIAALDDEARSYFVPPVYDLDRPDDFYRVEEQKISAINRRLAAADLDSEAVESLRLERRQRSVALQRAIFEHFVFTNLRGESRNLIEIFAAARQGMPPGGAGECAAPRLLHAAISWGLHPLALSEFWFGASPAGERRAHGCYYPSCMEKCAPILTFLLGKNGYETNPSPSEPTAASALRIIYDDDDIVAVSKPAGMLSVPGKDDAQPDVERWLLAHHPQCRPPMLVHRLDMATSGVMVATKNAKLHSRLQAAFASRDVHKTYVAWLHGHLASDSGVLSLPLCPNPDDRPRQVVDFHFGKTSISRYEVVRRCDVTIEGHTEPVTIVRLSPLTGRTHQLRVHAADCRGLGHPIVGDTLYNGSEQYRQTRLMLHAWRIVFPHPATGATTSIDDDSQPLLSRLHPIAPLQADQENQAAE